MNWRSIDGFLTDKDAEVLTPIIRSVGNQGWIIEIGCFKGRQSAFIAENKPESTLLSCIDPFPDKFVNFEDSKTYRNYMFYEWRDNLAAYKNVEAVRSLSPFNISYISFSKKPNLIIFDVDAIYDSLAFWAKHCDDQTLYVVHTYRHEHDRIISQVTKAEEEFNFNVKFENSLAFLSKRSL